MRGRRRRTRSAASGETVETSQPLATAGRSKQWTLAVVGLLLAAWALAMQVILLVVLAPKFGQVFADADIQAPAIRLVAAWHWPLIAVLVPGQVLCIVLAARKRRFGVWLLITGNAMSVATGVAISLFVRSVNGTLLSVASAIERARPR